MIKANGDMGRFAVIKYLFEGIDETKHSACIQAFAVDAWIAQKSVVRPENERISIKKV